MSRREIINQGKPIIPALSRAGIELDQKLREAIRIGAMRTGSPYDSEIFHALNRMNAVSTRYLLIDQVKDFSGYASSLVIHDERGSFYKRVEDVPASFYLAKILNSAIATRRHAKTLGTRDFLLTVFNLCLEHGDDFGSRPHTADLLSYVLTGSARMPLRSNAKLAAVLQALRRSDESAEDFQYILAMRGNEIVFRVTSVLDDYVQERSSGLLMPQRALLTHFKDRFGGFTEEEIEELDDLLNSRTSTEADLQRFFEKHTHFLRRWDHREVYPHVVLSRPEGPLVPDFILTDRELQRAAILELKLPRPKIVRRQRNRDRFASCIMEARTQLLRYRDWFREKRNRTDLKGKVGMEIYEPQLIAIIGRSSDFVDEFDRQRLNADHRDFMVVTYDDIATYAKRRRLFIEGGIDSNRKLGDD